ncbi:IS21 family transposase, partial [Pasteurellaceae bacterium HPA106]|uniref:Mu transposase domain-containing protein n=1 Tax=Spirabiliibacterium pneumoniae TaxID=221400 RepID=UPI0038B5FA08|nr:IS21 family transposase [Spirabiliibacterium pneumoniae]
MPIITPSPISVESHHGGYDNPKTIVKQIKRGKERTFNDGFLAMMNHFLIEPVACTPASGWEKGQVERQVQNLRKRLFRPLLVFSSLAELNEYLSDWCAKQIKTQPWIEDKQQTIAQRLEKEREILSPFRPYLGYRTTRLLVNTSALVLFDSHRYSVPCHLCGKEVIAQIEAEEVVLVYQNQIIAQHPRQFIKGGTSYNPLHYLSALKQKPDALRHGEPFQGWALPPAIKTLQHHLLKQPRGDQAMVKVLSLIADFGEPKIESKHVALS